MTGEKRLSIGVSGLDSILSGGVLPERSYLVRGGPGTGKTVLGLQYLMAGIEDGRTALYLSFEEPPNGIELGDKLSGLRGILSGSPELTDRE